MSELKPCPFCGSEDLKEEGEKMSKQEKLIKSVEAFNNNSGATLNDWVLLLLTSIADSLATIADTLQEEEEGTE